MTIDLTPQLLLPSVESVLCRCSIALPGQDGAGQGSTCAPNVLVCSFISVQEDKLNLRMFFFFFSTSSRRSSIHAKCTQCLLMLAKLLARYTGENRGWRKGQWSVGANKSMRIKALLKYQTHTQTNTHSNTHSCTHTCKTIKCAYKNLNASKNAGICRENARKIKGHSQPFPFRKYTLSIFDCSGHSHSHLAQRDFYCSCCFNIFICLLLFSFFWFFFRLLATFAFAFDNCRMQPNGQGK